MNQSNTGNRSFWASFGPGLLWAAAAIGVSHLVQSTRAGADAGFGLLAVIILALALKYPFFEFGPRYAAATRSSLVEGYGHIGRWALWLYLSITIVTAIISTAAVVLFTAFLFQFALGYEAPIAVTAVLVIAVCGGLLMVGRYQGLDMTIKIILVVLGISTLVAAAVIVPRADFSTLASWPGDIIGPVVPFAFLLALVGWMPSPVDTSVWSSLWTLAKDDASGHRTTVEAARTDFTIGYLGTAVLAVAFVTLGAGVMYGSGVEFSAAGTVFSTQLADLYASTLGAWARPVVLVAILTTMFSTSLTVIDGYPRAIERTFAVLGVGPKREQLDGGVGLVYWASGGVLAAFTIVILVLFIGNLTTMVDFATIVAFLTAPILGYLNLRVVTGADVPEEHRPGTAMVVWSWVGLVLLGGTGVVYLVNLLG